LYIRYVILFVEIFFDSYKFCIIFYRILPIILIDPGNPIHDFFQQGGLLTGSRTLRCYLKLFGQSEVPLRIGFHRGAAGPDDYPSGSHARCQGERGSSSVQHCFSEESLMVEARAQACSGDTQRTLRECCICVHFRGGWSNRLNRFRQGRKMVTHSCVHADEKECDDSCWREGVPGIGPPPVVLRPCKQRNHKTALVGGFKNQSQSSWYKSMIKLMKSWHARLVKYSSFAPWDTTPFWWRVHWYAFWQLELWTLKRKFGTLKRESPIRWSQLIYTWLSRCYVLSSLTLPVMDSH